MKNKKSYKKINQVNEKEVTIIERRDRECFRLKPNKPEPTSKVNLKNNDPKIKKREL